MNVIEGRRRRVSNSIFLCLTMPITQLSWLTIKIVPASLDPVQAKRDVQVDGAEIYIAYEPAAKTAGSRDLRRLSAYLELASED